MKALRILVSVAVWALLGTLLPPVATAVVVMTIEGVVTDPVGRPLQYAAVTDGSQTVYTDANGRYLLEEEAVRDYLVDVTKSGFDPAGRVVTPADSLGPVDFTLTYKAYLSVSPDAFQSDTDTTIQISVESVAPPSSTCMQWTDEDSGTVVSLALADSNPGGKSRWSGSYVSPAGRSEGRYAWELAVTECSDGTLLIAEKVIQMYIVDNTPPTLVSGVPGVTGDVDVSILSDSPFQVGTYDELSGVDPAVSMRLLNSSTGLGPLPLDATLDEHQVIRSEPVILDVGSEYFLETAVKDKAGNEAIATSEFSTIELAIPDVRATMAASTQEVKETDNHLTKTFVWEDPLVTLPEYSVNVSGQFSDTRFGYILRHFPLKDASIVLYKKDVTGEWVQIEKVPAPDTWGVRNLWAQVVASQVGIENPQLRIKEQVASLGTLQAEVDQPLAERAELVFDASLPGEVPACPDPKECGPVAYPTASPFPYNLEALNPFDGSSPPDGYDAVGDTMWLGDYCATPWFAEAQDTASGRQFQPPVFGTLACALQLPSTPFYHLWGLRGSVDQQTHYMTSRALVASRGAKVVSLVGDVVAKIEEVTGDVVSVDGKPVVNENGATATFDVRRNGSSIREVSGAVRWWKQSECLVRNPDNPGECFPVVTTTTRYESGGSSTEGLRFANSVALATRNGHPYVDGYAVAELYNATRQGMYYDYFGTAMLGTNAVRNGARNSALGGYLYRVSKGTRLQRWQPNGTSDYGNAGSVTVGVDAGYEDPSGGSVSIGLSRTWNISVGRTGGYPLFQGEEYVSDWSSLKRNGDSNSVGWDSVQLWRSPKGEGIHLGFEVKVWYYEP